MDELPKIANNISDKVLILQARDKYVRLHRKKQTDIETAKAVLGDCPDMCPEFERYCRQDRNLLSSFELTDGEPDEFKMVKEYRRSGADQEEPLPYELRPPEILDRTMLYLVTNIIDLIDEDESVIGDWFDFLWSRTRAIRKDITQQHLSDLTSVLLIERCARFHIYSAHRLIEQDISVFDQKINDENLAKCLQSLKDFYYDLSLKNIECPNEAEFRCYDILLNLYDGHRLREISHLKHSIRNSPLVKFAIKVYLAFTSNNFVMFFNLLTQTTFLNSCLMHRYFKTMRTQAFYLLRRAFTVGNQKEYFSKFHLLNQLCFDHESDLDDFCSALNIMVEDDNIILVRNNADFNIPSEYNEKCSLKFIESKKNRKIGQIIYGEEIKENPYQKYPLQNSFDENGQLKETKIKIDNQFIIIDKKTPLSSKPNQILKSETNKFGFNKDNTDFKSNNIFTDNNNAQFNVFKNIQSNQNSENLNLFNKKPTFSQNQPSFSVSKNFSSNIFKDQHNNLYTSSSLSNVFSKNENNDLNTNKDNFQFKVPSSIPKIKNSFSFKIPNPITNFEKKQATNDQLKLNDELIIQEPKKDVISSQEISTIAASIFQGMVNNIINEFIQKSILDVHITNQAVDVTNSLLNHTIDQLTRELCTSIYNYETKNRQNLLKLIGLASKQTCELLVEDVFQNFLKEVILKEYKIELNKFIDTKSKIIQNSYFEETLENLIFNLCSYVYKKEYEEHHKIINYIQNKRKERLAKEYFFYWKKRADYLKRLKFLKDNFPASKMESNPPIIEHNLPIKKTVNSNKRKLNSFSSTSSLTEILKNVSASSSKSLNYSFDTEKNLAAELFELDEKIKKSRKNEEFSIKSKLEYAKKSFENLKKVSRTFNTSLNFVKDFLKEKTRDN